MQANRRWIGAMLGLLMVFCTAGVSRAQSAATAKKPDPTAVLRQMCDYLKSLQEFSFHADVADDQVYLGGKKLQYGIEMETYVKRPDMVRVNAVGDLVNKEFFLHGKTLTLYDKDKDVYAAMPVPANIEDALAKANRDYGLRVALTDLASPQLWEHVSGKIQHSLYVGLHNVRGVYCHHLAFDGKDVGIQVWVDSGRKPLPLKIVLVHKTLQGEPQWTAYLSWKTAPRLSDALFKFTTPAGVKKIKFDRVKQPVAPENKKGEKS